ncbi:MAG: hypothetical protein CL840_14450 [Crocinitomicaceae bacterium]|nr:hypothetical protein [Crocinitomicaceae bacterium]|tara:strand:- start:5949 stop:7349 length:1401 start_codon:yes stop_codon:yes gene_type:complete
MKKHLSALCMVCLGLISLSVNAQNKYLADEFVTNSGSNKYTVVGDVSDGLSSPVDLDFNKTDLTELWVINMRTETMGGNTVTYRNAGKSNQEAFLKTDGNARHFMSLPTALAFGDKGDWANSPGVLDANFSGGQRAPFTGPSLWSSDFTIYAQWAGPGTNGSHLDMLHGSPRSMGIAWEVGNKYWLFDGENGHLVSYDFVIDHGPGNSNHDDGRLRRYQEIELKRNGLIPGHMEIDPERKWLYINDIGNSRIIRVDITSGNVKGSSSIPPREALAENNDIINMKWEVVASTGLKKPCGLDVDRNRLIVTDNETDEIIVYDITKNDGTFPEIGRISVPYIDIMGIKLDQEGKIWFVDKSAKVVIRIDNDNAIKKVKSDGSIVSVKQAGEKQLISFFPNPANEVLNFNGLNSNVELVIHDIAGRIALENFDLTPGNSRVDISTLTEGMYVVTLKENGAVVYQNKLIKR